MIPFFRVLLSFISVIVIFTLYGINIEHGDANAGSMYGVIAIVPTFFIVLTSYFLYYVFDLVTKNNRLNKLKSYIHLTLFIALTWLDPKGAIYPLLIISLVDILIVNVLYLYNHNRLTILANRPVNRAKRL